jgi:chloride channel 3/4/5
MSEDLEAGNERTPLLHDRRSSNLHGVESSTLSKEEQQLVDSTVGERLPYNDYTTIDWLHDLVQSQGPCRSVCD